MPVSNWLASLDAVGAGDIGRVGGKAAALGELLRAGLEVPSGFVITCDAFRTHLSDGGIDALLIDRGPSGPVAADIRSRFLAAPMSPLLRSEVTLALDLLGSGPVAVRSSALAEDLPGMSFAGQHDTFLNVSGSDAVLEAIQRCWASLFSEHAVSYRRLHGFGLADAAMACVVQRMVPAEAAGVAFTADPLTGERDRIVVNVVAGLGESLVSGRATADEYLIAKRDGAVLHRRTSGALKSSAEGPLLQALARVAVQAEQHFKAPQDIEWALAEGQLFVLQSRPITNLRDEPVGIALATRPLLAYLDRVREMFPSAGTPLLNDLVFRSLAPTILRNAVWNGIVPRAAAAAGLPGRIVRGRFYVDLDVATSFVPGMNAVALLDLAENGRLPPLRAISPRLLFTLLIQAPRAVPIIVRALLRLDGLERESLAVIDRLMRPYELADMRSLDRAELQGLLRLEPTPAFERALIESPPANALARGLAPSCYVLLQWMCEGWAGEPGESASSLVSGLSGLVEVECAVALWDLAQSARSVPAVAEALAGEPSLALARIVQVQDAAPWLEQFRAFLDSFGHRAIEEVEIGRPRWREQPEYPLSVIASYLRCAPEASPRAVAERRGSERRIVEQRILKRLRFRPLRKFLFRGVLDIAQKASLAGENTKSAIRRIFWIMRVAALELGRRLAVAGRIPKAEDIFFLELAEIENENDGDLHARAAARLKEYERWQKDDAPRIIDGLGRAVKEGLRPVRHAHEDPDVLTGIPTSPGVARGRARVVMDPSKGVIIHEGEILIAPYTDPAWTPLFIPAAAVVVEIGSLLSHASIVAREMGIPSVVAVAGATRELKDGDLIEVDGRRGTVRRLR